MIAGLLKEAALLAQQGDIEAFNAFMARKVIRKLPLQDRMVFGALTETCFRNAVKKLGSR